MIDYRLPGGPRQSYFDALYRTTLEHRISPGLVYLYLPFLRDRLNWDREQCLWAAFVTGMTQNTLTTLRILEQLPGPPSTPQALTIFSQWFGASWSTLSYDTDRRYAKKETVAAVRSYCKLLCSEHVEPGVPDPQSYLFDADGGDWENLWDLITGSLRSFGRLSAWSYLEYVRIYGSGLDPSSMLFEDASGSRSHRNGMLFLCDLDHLVDDKRADDGIRQRGEKYDDFKGMCGWLEKRAEEKLGQFANQKDAGPFTLESALCAFKNSFFGRRYLGVYADMGWERLQWYETSVGKDDNWKLIMEAREALPGWLREESKPSGLTLKQKAAMFPQTGVPYRAEHFL